jgi:hypothetical protein
MLQPHACSLPSLQNSTQRFCTTPYKLHWPPALTVIHVHATLVGGTVTRQRDRSQHVAGMHGRQCFIQFQPKNNLNLGRQLNTETGLPTPTFTHLTNHRPKAGTLRNENAQKCSKKK